MRVLFLSNYFPPRVRGGYELWCHEVGVELVARGHQLCTLTSVGCGLDRGLSIDGGIQVRRELHLEVEGGLLQTTVRLAARRTRLEQDNLARVREVVAAFRPDAGLIWGMWNVPRSVPALVEDLLGTRVAYYLCDYWPSLPSAYLQQWQAPARRKLAQLPKRLARGLVVMHLSGQPHQSLRLEHPICVSRAVREVLVQTGVGVGHAQVIYGGTRPQEFVPRNGRNELPRDAGGLRALYAGRVTPEKGVHTAIHAVARLAQSTNRSVTLDIVGSGDPSYARDLRRLVSTYGLNGRVRFRGGVAHSEMPALLGGYDVLVHGSEWQEPFARVVLEAMAAGLVVVGTTTGGSHEVLVEGETGLTAAPSDAESLARQLCRLLDDPTLGQRLAATARRRIEERFTFRGMVDQIEAALGRLVDNSP